MITRTSSVNKQKVDYYNTREVREWVLAESACNEVRFSSIATTWRGAMAKETAEILHRIGITAGDRQLMIVKVLEGNVRTKENTGKCLLAHFTLWMWAEYLPDDLLKGRTVFIPKEEGTQDPLKFRPITIASTITRCLHKIQADRIKIMAKDNPRQKGFKRGDGTAENLAILQCAISECKRESRSLKIALVDVAKAFDSVSHAAIAESALKAEVDPKLIRFVMNGYARQNAELVYEGDTLSVKPARGVRQGDPLSPVLFNLVMDQALEKLPATSGVRINSARVNYLAYADDVVLLAETEVGLQHSIKVFEENLKQAGLEVNQGKCATIDFASVPKDKTIVVRTRKPYQCSKGNLPAMNVSEFYKYLGVELGASGTRITCIKRLEEKIMALRKAPLKPQQRLWILKTHLIPGLYHQLTLGTVSKDVLSGMDRVLRRTVRSFLHWPKDTPMEMFHAAEDAGGLGIPLLQVCIPILKEQRMVKILNSSDELMGDVAKTSFFKNQMRMIGKLRGKINGGMPKNKQETKETLKMALHEKLDGKGLKTISLCGGHSVLTNGTLLMNGKTFINVLKIRGNLIATKARMARWHKGLDTSCDSCGRRETLGHILQVCPRSWGERIKRHDQISAFVAKKAKSKGFRIWEEPIIKTVMGIRKPDLVIVQDSTALVLDTIICSDNADL